MNPILLRRHLRNYSYGVRKSWQRPPYKSMSCLLLYQKISWIHSVKSHKTNLFLRTEKSQNYNFRDGNVRRIYIDIIPQIEYNVLTMITKGARYMEQLLIVEDDIGLNQGLSKVLKADNRQIISCHDLKAAKEQLLCGSVSLILLDINLPDGSGLDLLKEVKEKTPDIPVILLTANDTDMDIVDGLERGADDYITKPFSLSILRARVNTQLRKKITIPNSTPIRIDHFCFDFGTMTFCVGDAKVELSKTEQKLLHLLVENRGQIMPRGVLVGRIWTDGAEYVDESALSVTMKRLRDKLGAQEYIKTFYGIGYSWVKR